MTAAKVLIVEDDASIRSFVRSALEQEGYGVDEAPDGARGLARITAAKPDLIVLQMAAGDEHGARPGHGRKRFAQRSRRKQPQPLVVHGRIEHQKVKIAAEPPMLEPVIEEKNVSPELGHGKAPRGDAVGLHHHRDAG